MKVKRCKLNPILKASDFAPYNDNLEAVLSFNPGVTKYNNKIMLIVRVAVKAKQTDKNIVGVPYFDSNRKSIEVKNFNINDPECDFSDNRLIKKNNELFLTTLSYFSLAESDDGVNFVVKENIFMIGDNDYESFGIEDPRITKIGNTYYINYSGVSKDGICTMLARTQDFVNVEKLGPIFMPDNKDVVIFPKKIGGKYVAISRPESAYFKKPNMWISYSKDLLCWGEHKLFMRIRDGFFDSSRIGASCVPILLDEGWLLIYHGATKDNVYTLGACLLDKNNPNIVIKRTSKPIMYPDAPYEKNGFMPNVIFSCGCIKKGGSLVIYYGACDESICVSQIKIKDIINDLYEDK